MKKRNVIALSLLGVIILVLLFYQTPLMRYSRNFAWDVWVHGVARMFGMGSIDIPQSVFDQLEVLRLENIRLRAQLRQGEKIQEQLGTYPMDHTRAIPAAVVSRPLDTFNSEFVINKGASEGIVMGAPVTVRGSVLVGTIVEIHDHTAIVQSLFHPSTHITAEAISEDEEFPPARGLLQSRYYTTLVLTTVPRDILLEHEQQVVTVQKDADIPYGLIIGTIEEITSKEHEAYQEARLLIPYNLDAVDAVRIIVP